MYRRRVIEPRGSQIAMRPAAKARRSERGITTASDPTGGSLTLLAPLLTAWPSGTATCRLCAVTLIYISYPLVVGNTVGRIFDVVGLFLLISAIISMIRLLSR